MFIFLLILALLAPAPAMAPAMEKLTRITLLDNTMRPKAPKFEDVKPAQLHSGQRLRLFHNLHRDQLRQVHDAMLKLDQDLFDKIANLALRDHIKSFGNLCGQECQMLTGHHGIEDAYIFPPLHRRGDSPMKKVVERLAAEHLVIHDLIEDLDTAARQAQATPGTAAYTNLKSAFTNLHEAVLSHFGYEETELAEALGVYGVEI
jgi:iron-sulfur cluster repair protein YtfE (RIC family)